MFTINGFFIKLGEAKKSAESKIIQTENSLKVYKNHFYEDMFQGLVKIILVLLNMSVYKKR